MTEVLPWYDRLYIWTRMKFMNEDLEQASKSNTCKYLRTLLIWLPFFIFFFTSLFVTLLGVIGGIIYAIITATWTWALILHILQIAGGIIGVVVVFLLMIVGVVFLVSWLFEKYSSTKPQEKIIKKRWKWSWSWTITNPFLLRAIATIKDYHNKVCTEFNLG